MLVKLYGPTFAGPGRYSPVAWIGANKVAIKGRPDKAYVSTAYVG